MLVKYWFWDVFWTNTINYYLVLHFGRCWLNLCQLYNLHLQNYTVLLIDSLHFYIPRIHPTIVASSSFVNTLDGSIFLDLVFPAIRFDEKKKYISLFNSLFHWICPLSITSMASSNVWFVHLFYFIFLVGIY